MKECHATGQTVDVAGAQMRGGKAAIVLHPARHRQDCRCHSCSWSRLTRACRSPADAALLDLHRARLTAYRGAS